MALNNQKKQRKSVGLAVASLAVLSAIFQVVLPSTFLLPPHDSTQSASSRVNRREAVGAALAGALAVGFGSSTEDANAKDVKAITQKDLDKLVDGYNDLVYLLGNWDKATRKCMYINSGKAGATDVEEQGLCDASADEVRKYIGVRSLKAKLYGTADLWTAIELSDMNLIPKKEEDRYADLIEEFEKYKREADSWAYNSVWAESNPGGGKDKTEEYLLKAKEQVQLLKDALGQILKIIGQI
eukprot:TRINITY_DN81543_c0_g1_i1.p1 TRINITY_DN81543_c0_g1~~TRINITY_DN81543_c0_g1_i1.p1  ORF type:complete len:257 (-),score=52.52 TRINITY_DN81543_c0_g1_i1:42-764(-)